jgi:hypothetical protein
MGISRFVPGMWMETGFWEILMNKEYKKPGIMVSFKWFGRYIEMDVSMNFPTAMIAIWMRSRVWIRKMITRYGKIVL